MKFISVLEEMGCRKEWSSSGGLKLYAPEDGKLKGVDINMADFFRPGTYTCSNSTVCRITCNNKGGLPYKGTGV